MAGMVARCFGKPPSVYFSRKIRGWEIGWMPFRSIPEGRRGCFVKVKSWFYDEGVQAVVREWIAEHPADQITAYGLQKNNSSCGENSPVRTRGEIGSG